MTCLLVLVLMLRLLKEHPADFVLWKANKSRREFWSFQPLGDGRPGWHIECSAMSTSCLEVISRYSWWWVRILSFHIMKNEIAAIRSGKQAKIMWIIGCNGRGSRNTKKCPNHWQFFSLYVNVLAEILILRVVRYLMVSSQYRKLRHRLSDQKLLEAKSWRLERALYRTTPQEYQWEFFS